MRTTDEKPEPKLLRESELVHLARQTGRVVLPTMLGFVSTFEDPETPGFCSFVGEKFTPREPSAGETKALTRLHHTLYSLKQAEVSGTMGPSWCNRMVRKAKDSVRRLHPALSGAVLSRPVKKLEK